MFVDLERFIIFSLDLLLLVSFYTRCAAPSEPRGPHGSRGREKSSPDAGDGGRLRVIFDCVGTGTGEHSPPGMAPLPSVSVTR